MQSAISEELHTQIGAVIGPIDTCIDRSWRHADSSVFEINNSHIVKIFPQARKWKHELQFYKQFSQKLTFTPKLLAVFDKPQQALLLSKLPGTLVAHNSLPQSVLPDIYFQAGQHLRHLHQLPITDNDPLPLGNAHLKRAQAWLQRASGICDSNDIDWVQHQLAALTHLNHTKRVMCHRDYTARNWIWHQNHLHIIDFEMSQPDWWLGDCERLMSGVFYQQPSLQKYFFDGYGKQPLAEELAILHSCSAVAALATIVWATEHNDDAFLQDGQQRLSRLQLSAH